MSYTEAESLDSEMLFLTIYFRTYLINIHKYLSLSFVAEINTILKLELLCFVKSLNLFYFTLYKINWRTEDNYPNKSTKNKVLQHLYVMNNEKDEILPVRLWVFTLEVWILVWYFDLQSTTLQ